MHLPTLQVDPAGQFWSVVHSGLGTHLLAWQTNPALQFVSLAHSWHCPATQTSLCDLHCSSESHLGYVGGHPVRSATPRTAQRQRGNTTGHAKSSTDDRRVKRSVPWLPLYRHDVMTVKTKLAERVYRATSLRLPGHPTGVRVMSYSVLLVDDEKNILLTLSQALQLAGYHTELAGDRAGSALEVALATPGGRGADGRADCPTWTA